MSDKLSRAERRRRRRITLWITHHDDSLFTHGVSIAAADDDASRDMGFRVGRRRLGRVRRATEGIRWHGRARRLDRGERAYYWRQWERLQALIRRRAAEFTYMHPAMVARLLWEAAGCWFCVPAVADMLRVLRVPGPGWGDALDRAATPPGAGARDEEAEI